MTTTMTDPQKSKKILDSIEARDTSSMGYEAKLRHKERIEEARYTHQQAIIADCSDQPAANPTA